MLEEISTNISLRTPPMEPVQILYTSSKGEEIRMVERTSLGLVKEKDRVFKIMEPAMNKDTGPAQVTPQNTVKASMKITIQPFHAAHFLSL